MTFNRILLIHFGQLGDSVLALPAAHALRASYPRAHMTILASAKGAEVFRMAGFESIWPVDRVAWKRNPFRGVLEISSLISRLRHERFGLSVDLHTFKETNLLAWAAGIPERVAMLRPTRSIPWLITCKPPADNPDGILLDRYCTVLEPLGINVTDRIPRLTPPAWARSRVSEEFKVFDGHFVLGVCPGAGHPSRRWPTQHFASVISAFLRSNTTSRPFKVALFPGPEESEIMLKPLKALPDVQCIYVLHPAELAAALARCYVVLANDSGPAHIAAAVGTRVVSVGSISQFDPVGKVKVVRACPRVSDVPISAVVSAVEQMWSESLEQQQK